MASNNALKNGDHALSTTVQYRNNVSKHINGNSNSKEAQCVICTVKASKNANDAIDMDQVRSHFPVLGGKTVPFNNAAGTVVLKDAIAAYVLA